MAKTTISRVQTDREWDNKEFNHYVRDGAVIGSARHTNGLAMEELVVYQGDAPKYSLKETDRVFWFFYHCLYLISLALQLFLAPKYKIFGNGGEVGYSKEKHTKAARTFLICGEEYRLFDHNGNRFSLTKNGVQIALYAKRPEEMLHYQPNTYDIRYEKNEEIEIIELFCIFIDKTYFTNYNGRTNVKIIVLHDPYSNHTLWQPKE